MNILQIGAGWFPESPGGLERVYHALCCNLPNEDLYLSGLVVGSPRVQVDTDGQVRAVARAEALLPIRWWRFRRAAQHSITTDGIDIIAAHFALYAFPLLDLLGDRPFVMHFHGPWADESSQNRKSDLTARVKASLERAVYRRADRCIVLSEAFREVLCDDYGVPSERIRIVPGGVDMNRFDIDLSQIEARQHLDWPRNQPIVLTVRRLTRRMGLENLIDATEMISHHIPDFQVHIAGTGPLVDDLKRRIARRGLEKYIRLLGFVPDDLLPVAYRAADVSIVPTVALEGFGLITLESLAAGTPVLVTPVGGLPETVQGLDPELVLDDTSPHALAKGLIRVLSDRRTLPDAEACQSYVRSHFNWPNIAQRVRDVYEEVL